MTALAERRVLRLPSELTRDEIVEDLEFMASDSRVGFVEAAHRVGKTVDGCERFLYRMGHADLIAALRANDPTAEPIHTPALKSDAWTLTHAAFLVDCETERLAALATWPDDDMARERRMRALGGAA